MLTCLPRAFPASSWNLEHSAQSLQAFGSFTVQSREFLSPWPPGAVGAAVCRGQLCKSPTLWTRIFLHKKQLWPTGSAWPLQGACSWRTKLGPSLLSHSLQLFQVSTKSIKQITTLGEAAKRKMQCQSSLQIKSSQEKEKRQSNQPCLQKPFYFFQVPEPGNWTCTRTWHWAANDPLASSPAQPSMLCGSSDCRTCTNDNGIYSWATFWDVTSLNLPSSAMMGWISAVFVLQQAPKLCLQWCGAWGLCSHPGASPPTAQKAQESPYECSVSGWASLLSHSWALQTQVTSPVTVSLHIPF